MSAGAVTRFLARREEPGVVVLSGLHALKHALRFGAAVDEVVAVDPVALEALAAELAPDVAEAIATRAEAVTPAQLAALAPHAHRTGVLALARRPSVDLQSVLEDPMVDPVVLLEAPRSPHNLGAVIRVAAAAGARAVLVTGDLDPWSAAALRASAGLHFALDVARAPATWVEAGGRPLVCLDPDGAVGPSAALPTRAILAFGTERAGLRASTLAAADRVVRIPMRAGVSSLNLATAVSAVLFAGTMGAAGLEPATPTV